MIIDKKKDYIIGSYMYRNFVNLSLKEKEMVLSWRNNDKIRRWMNHSEIIPLENHLRYIDTLKEREDVYYWLVCKDNEPIGVVDILDADYEKDQAETGYYLTPDLLDAGLGFEFYYYFKSFFHDYLQIGKTVGELMVGNVNSYMLITYFGGQAVEVKKRECGTFLVMETKKDEFDSIKEGANDILKFARFFKNNKVNWTELIMRIDHNE